MKELKSLEGSLESKIGARVKLKLKGSDKKGKIEIPYKSIDEFNSIYDVLMKL